MGESGTSSTVSDQPNSLRFQDQAYKFVMLLGLVSEDNPLAQTLVGDRGGIAAVVEYMNHFRDNKVYVKWCSWSLIVSTVFWVVLCSEVSE